MKNRLDHIPRTGYKVYMQTNGTPKHAEELVRLGRIAGQVGGIRRMIEEDRYCMEILVQLKAVRAALKKVEGNVLKRHMSECVVQAMGGNREEAEQKVAELQRYFQID